MFKNPNALREFFNKVSEREKVVGTKVKEYSNWKGLSEETEKILT
jgi:hypothetical protein